MNVSVSVDVANSLGAELRINRIFFNHCQEVNTLRQNVSFRKVEL